MTGQRTPENPEYENPEYENLGDIDRQDKKMVVPIAVTVVTVVLNLVVSFFIGMAYWMVMLVCGGVTVTVLFVLVVLASLIPSAIMVGVCVSRIKEIKGGEEDDLSNY